MFAEYGDTLDVDRGFHRACARLERRCWVDGLPLALHEGYLRVYADAMGSGPTIGSPSASGQS